MMLQSLPYHGRFAGSLLKRTLSESMASGAGGVGAEGAAEAAELYGRGARDRAAPRRLALAARSLSLELARHRHRLAAQLVSSTLLSLCYIPRPLHWIVCALQRCEAYGNVPMLSRVISSLLEHSKQAYRRPTTIRVVALLASAL
jgi:hypothetical protein